MGTKKVNKEKTSKKASKTDKLRATREAQAGKKRGDAIPADAPETAHRKPAKRQPELEGFGRVVDAELDQLGCSYDEKSVIMSGAQKEMDTLKGLIVQRMAQLGLRIYRYHDGNEIREIRFKPEKLEIVKVKERTIEVGG